MFWWHFSDCSHHFSRHQFPNRQLSRVPWKTGVPSLFTVPEHFPIWWRHRPRVAKERFKRWFSKYLFQTPLERTVWICLDRPPYRNRIRFVFLVQIALNVILLNTRDENNITRPFRSEIRIPTTLPVRRFSDNPRSSIYHTVSPFYLNLLIWLRFFHIMSAPGRITVVYRVIVRFLCDFPPPSIHNPSRSNPSSSSPHSTVNVQSVRRFSFRRFFPTTVHLPTRLPLTRTPTSTYISSVPYRSITFFDGKNVRSRLVSYPNTTRTGSVHVLLRQSRYFFIEFSNILWRSEYRDC